MSSRAGKRPLRSLSAHEKLEAIRRVHDGESKASVARDIGVPESTLRGWCKNEDKISYLSRQSSSPETDESLEAHSHGKKPKLADVAMQPFNLSLKNNTRYSPNSPNSRRYASSSPSSPLDAFRGEQEIAKAALNLHVKSDTPKVSTEYKAARPKNKEELARMSVAFGLNTEEKFAGNPRNAATLSDLSANINLITQWNTIMLQQQQKMQYAGKSKALAPPDSTMPSAGLLTTVDQERSKLLPKEQQNVNEAIWFWLKDHQAKVVMNQNAAHANNAATSATTQMTTSSNVSTNAAMKAFQGMSPDSTWFWNWYNDVCSRPQPAHTADKPILYQQLTKESPQRDIPDQHNAENVLAGDGKTQTVESKTPNGKTPNGKTLNINGNGSSKGRSALDNLLSQNNILAQNGNSDSNKEEGDVLSRSEALEHGEQFLRWLEDCSDPSVTAIQLMQFKTLLNNVRSGAERKKLDLEHKTKVRKQ